MLPRRVNPFFRFSLFLYLQAQIDLNRNRKGPTVEDITEIFQHQDQVHICQSQFLGSLPSPHHFSCIV